ncbi:MAG: 50S ribosomal protein L10 [Acidimicrobiales bacterium]
MDNPRPEKVAVVDEVRQRFDGAGGALITEYRGLNVAAMAQLRRSLSDAGGDFKIYKNTLVRFAARDLGLDLDGLLTGPTAIAFVRGDPVNVAKALRDFARTNPALVVKGGMLGDKVLDAAGARALAEVEPRDVLLARLAGAMAAPMQQFAGLLSALPRNLAYGLKALIEQRGGLDPAPFADTSTDGADAPADEPSTSDRTESIPADSTAADSPAAGPETDTPDSPETATPAETTPAGSTAADSAAAGTETDTPETATPADSTPALGADTPTDGADTETADPAENQEN